MVPSHGADAQLALCERRDQGLLSIPLKHSTPLQSGGFVRGIACPINARMP